jgi:tetratricopeptide (TPR) repeat protein
MQKSVSSLHHPRRAPSARLVGLLVAIPVAVIVTAGNVYLFDENRRAGQNIVESDKETVKDREARAYQRALNQFAANDLERAAAGFRLLGTTSNDIEVRARANLRLLYCYRRLGHRALVGGDGASAERWFQFAADLAPEDEWVRRELETARALRIRQQSQTIMVPASGTTAEPAITP